MSTEQAKRAGYRSALRSRDLRLLLSSQIISATGGWAYSVALAVWLYDQTHSTSWVAAGAIGRFVPTLVFSPYAGVIAERFERIRLMAWLNAIAFVIQLGLAATMDRHGPAAIAITLAALTALSQTPYLPSVAAVIPQVTDEEDLAAANALNSTVDNLVVLIGPAIGAVLLVVGGATLAILVNAASFAIAIPVVLAIRVRSAPSDVTDDGESGIIRQITIGFQAVVSSTTVAIFVAFSVLASFVYGTDTVLFIPIAKVQLHSGSSGYGYLLAGLGAGGVLGATFINRLAANPRLTGPILGGMAVYCVPTAILITVHQPVVGFVLEVIRGAGTLVVDTLAFTALQRSVAPEMVARVFGVFFALILGAITLGALITPVLLTAGLHTTMLIFGLGLPALCLLTLPQLSALDRVASERAAVLAPRIAILERMDLFAAASRASLEALASAAEEIEVPARTAVVEEGAVADAFYAVVSGTLSVSAVGENGGKRKQLRKLEPDSYFGEIGLIARIPRTATVRATSRCTLLRIDGNAFIDALTTMSASSSLLSRAQQRLTRTHPSNAALTGPDRGVIDLTATTATDESQPTVTAGD